MALLHQQFVSLLPGIADARSFAIWDGNGVGILMIQDEDVIVATAGGDVETTSLIRVGLQDRLIVEKCDGYLMGARLGWRSNVDVGVGNGNRR